MIASVDLQASTFTWIRSPAWDMFWFLSAPALGLILALKPGLTALYLWLQTSHFLAPIILAWLHRGYRPTMLARPWKFIGVPVSLFAVAGAITILTCWLYPRFVPHNIVLEKMASPQLLFIPLVAWVNLHAVWDLYHVGAQQFGFLCLYRRKGWPPGMMKWVIVAAFVLGGILLGHGLPRLDPWSFLFVLGLLGVNHSMASIGLCAHVHSRHRKISPLWFVAGMIVAGYVVSWLFVAGRDHWTPEARVFVYAAFSALAIWHFLQDRWIWKMSDPQVRSTIGSNLFAAT